MSGTQRRICRHVVDHSRPTKLGAAAAAAAAAASRVALIRQTELGRDECV